MNVKYSFKTQKMRAVIILTLYHWQVFTIFLYFGTEIRKTDFCRLKILGMVLQSHILQILFLLWTH